MSCGVVDVGEVMMKDDKTSAGDPKSEKEPASIRGAVGEAAFPLGFSVIWSLYLRAEFLYAYILYCNTQAPFLRLFITGNL